MMEHGKLGPLDVVRSVNSEAERYDFIIRSKRVLDEDDPVVSDITELDNNNPLNGREVMISGDMVVPAMREVDGGVAIRMVVAEEGPGRSVRGIYRGVSIMQGIPGASGEKQNRLAHVIETHRANYSTQLLNGREDIFYSYVCADGSTILPIEPVGAHSLLDLHNNPSAEMVDQMIYDESQNPIDIVRTLSRYFVRRLRYPSAQAHLTTLQLVSYVESTGIFKDKIVAATDMIVGDHPSSDEINPDSTFYFADHGVEIATDRLAILQGYRRLRAPSGGDNFYMASLRQHELYVRGEDADGLRVTVPLKCIIEIA